MFCQARTQPFPIAVMVVKVRFNPCGTRTGLINSAPIIPGHIMARSLPCRPLPTGALSPFMTHPIAHPSGPSNVAGDSSVKRTYFTSDLMYFLAQLRRKSLCLDKSEGLFCESLGFAICPSIVLCVLSGMHVRADSCKIVPGTFRKFLFKLLTVDLTLSPR